MRGNPLRNPLAAFRRTRTTRYYIEDHGTQQPPRHSLSSRYIENYSSGWQPTDQIEEVEPPQSLTSPLHYGLPGWQPTEIEEVEPPPYLTWQPTQIEEVEPPQSLTWRPTQIKEVEAPHYLTWQPTQIEEVEPPQSLTWQPTQIEEVEAPHSLTSPPHTLTSRTRRTGPGIIDRVIVLFSSGGGGNKKKHQPTKEEKKMLKEICATNSVHKNHVSCLLCLNISTFLKSQTSGSNLSEQGIIYVRRRPYREENCEIFSIVSLFSLIFPRAVNIAPGVGFRRSWCIQKACDTIFLKVSDLRISELGFGRYGPANRGSRRVFPHQRVIFKSRFRLDRGSS
uniref:Uncharacterized protein n=1 Tax=Fagus sylvatica TaxID=28930 RepID=A0A2N9G8C8_FAGSY